MKKDVRYAFRKEVTNVNEEKCAQCGTPTRPGAKFCEGCGTTLAAASQAMQPTIPTTQLKEVTYIPVVQLAKVVGAIAAVIFFIYGLFLALTIGVSIGSIPGFSGVSGVFAAILVIILMPIFGFIVGFVGAAIEALIYNWIAPRIGGIQVNLR